MTLELIEHLQTNAQPLFVRRTGVVVFADEDRHVAAFEADPTGYALLALVPGVLPQQRARVLLRLLEASWTGFTESTRETLGRVARVLTLGLDAPLVATVLLALRRRRANHKHVTRAAVRLLVEHPAAGSLVHTHRAVLASIVEHALGKATARGCVRALAGETVGTDPRRALLRFAADPTLAAVRIQMLYSRSSAPTERPDAAPAVDLDLDGERPATVTATNRGDIAATLVHRFRGSAGLAGFASANPAPAGAGRASPELDAALDGYVATAAARVPAFPGSLALVVDASTSMRGYGDREWAVLSQAQALCAVLERRCARLTVITVEGATDLATGVLDGLDTGPDLVAVLSDGYENVLAGDLARVCATLPRIGVSTPVVFCHSTFGHSDDLALRRPAPSLPQRAFWHEADFGPLVLWLLAQARHPALFEALRERLAAVEHRLTIPTTTLEGATR